MSKRTVRIMETMNILIIMGMFIFLLVRWGALPDEIPKHFNYLGEADKWGSKSTILIMPVFSVVLNILLGLGQYVSKVAQDKIKKDEVQQLKYTNAMVSILKLQMNFFFLYIFLGSVYMKELHKSSALAMQVIVYGTIAYYIFKMIRVNKGEKRRD